MPATHAFDYAVIRVVPFVERGEFINVGIILFCRTRRFLAARVQIDHDRLQVLAPKLDLQQVQTNVALIPKSVMGPAPSANSIRPSVFIG